MEIISFLLAQSGDLPDWTQWGFPGLVIVAIATRQFVPGWSHSDLRAENTELKKENKELVQLLLATQRSTIPALEEAARAVNEAMTELRLRRGNAGQREE